MSQEKKKLLIVESPNKIHTIQSILGDDYQVEASVGHIRDLATTGKGGLGVDIEDNFTPHYVVSPLKKDIVKKLKDAAKKSSEVILATDPDREGEAISWHIAKVLDLDIDNTKRLEFHEVTKNAILKALANPRTIDLNLVASQETRRIIDRIIGFKLSTLLKSKIKSRSAGRVQSVTLKFIVDREKEINSFIPEEYWTIKGSFANNSIEAILKGYKKDGTEIKYVDKEILASDETSVEEVSKVKIKDEKTCDEIISKLPNEFTIAEFSSKEVSSKPKAPFTTSTMQQTAFSQYKFSTKKTALIAQKLYEGKEIDGEFKGLITYMRTDSDRLSEEFVTAATSMIETKYGKQYIGTGYVSKNNKNSQDAHEAIRPTDLNITPEIAKKHLSIDEYKLYKLIYDRAVSCMMANKVDKVTTLILEGNGYLFEAKASSNVFDGYSKIYGEYEDYQKDTSLPQFIVGNKVEKNEINKSQHYTKPPLRYTEGKIIKLMEDKGIGRPSTYASTISTLSERDYVEVNKGTLIPTDKGVRTVEQLSEFFPDFMQASYTANMESQLDSIVEGDSSRINLLTNFCNDFFPLYDYAKEHMEKLKDEEVGRNCPICGKPLVKKYSSYGEFIACSGYPDCKYIEKKQQEVEIIQGEKCPLCGGDLVKRKSKRGEFIGCSNYPKCNYIKGNEENKPVVLDRLCPECGSPLVERKNYKTNRSFIGCSNYPKCHYIEKKSKKEKKETTTDEQE